MSHKPCGVCLSLVSDLEGPHAAVEEAAVARLGVEGAEVADCVAAIAVPSAALTAVLPDSPHWGRLEVQVRVSGKWAD